MEKRAKKGKWSGRAAFILAAMGSAIGLGSIWKFPYMVGMNGGGAFVVVYLIGLAVIVLPLLVAEFVIGRRGKSNAIDSVLKVAAGSGASRGWAIIGRLGVAVGYLILSFYSVIGGWTMAYVPIAATGAYGGADAAAITARFDALLASPVQLAFWHGLFMAVTVWVIARGVTNGIELAVEVLMPALFIILIGLSVYAAFEGGVGRTLSFLFAPDIGKMTPKIILDAIGLGFFSISVGMGVMITYAAYVGREVKLIQAAIVTIIGDTIASFLAGFAMFPIVFGNGLDPAGGPGLMFVTLPLAFVKLPFGRLVGAAFFILLFVSALASAISLLEIIVSWSEDRLRLGRPLAAVLSGAICWLLGLGTVLSFNRWKGWHPLAFLPGFDTKTFFDVLDYLTSNILLPLGGGLIALFVGWVLHRSVVEQELGHKGWKISSLRFLLRVVCPVVILLLFIVNIGFGGGGE